MTSIKHRALDAAVDLVGTEGVRSLTHARVDERGGLPRGSASNHFRTRAALLSGTIDWIVEREMHGVGDAMAPATAEELIDSLCALLEHVTGRDRVLTSARLALFMEASHDPDLREVVSRGRTVMEASVVATFERLGARDPHTSASAVMACSEGLILHRIARNDESDPRPTYALIVRAALDDGAGRAAD